MPWEHPVTFINTEGLSDWDYPRYPRYGFARVDILGPEGVELEPWSGVEPRIVDLAPERERQRVMGEVNQLIMPGDSKSSWRLRPLRRKSGE